MPPTCNSYSHSWHTLPRYNPLFIYKYSWLIETTHDFQEHAATIKDNPQLSNDIYFLDHINQTIWWMEKAAIHQKWVTQILFDQMIENGLEQKIAYILE